MRCWALALLLFATSAIGQDASSSQQVEAGLREAVPGARFGLVVATADGREIVAVRPDERFVPASSTKLFVTAAAFATVAGLDRPDVDGGAAVRLEPGGAAPDLVLEGHGDARLSSAGDCRVDCLAALADAVAARTRLVGDVIGDDSAFPDERWGPGMSWNNLQTRSGTAASALTLDDNELVVTATPAAAAGQVPRLAALPYYRLDNRATTVATGATGLRYRRLPGERCVRIEGSLAQGTAPVGLRLAIDDPADYAAWRLRALLSARGVTVRGAVRVRHRAPVPGDDPAVRGLAPPARAPRQPVLARLTPPPLAADIALTNKSSQNLHAELLLRRLGGTGSIADGQAIVAATLAQAGVARRSFDFADGAGMSTYNRVTPRATVRLLRWAVGQRWGQAWRATLPVAGVNGTLARRFAGTPLEGRLFAKTGTLNAATALSGYLIAASGRELTFAAFAADMPGDALATNALDAALLRVAAEN